MSGSVTNCMDCNALVWAGTTICPECGSSHIAPTLRQLHDRMYQTDASFKKMVDDQREKDRHCPKCGSPIDREGFLKEHGYSEEGEYNCPNCGHNIIRIRHTGVKA